MTNPFWTRERVALAGKFSNERAARREAEKAEGIRKAAEWNQQRVRWERNYRAVTADRPAPETDSDDEAAR